MQEQFTIRKTLRKIAAVGTSVAMLGMTLTGALAQTYTLSDYPRPFTTNTVVVVGSAADEADSTAAADITFSLAGSPTTTATAAATTPAAGKLEFESDQLEDIPLNRSLIDATDGFRANLTDSHLKGFKDASIRIDIGDVDDDYNYHEEVRLTANARVETGLTYNDNRDEDWKDRIFFPMKANSVGYFFVFDENLKAGNYIANATQTDPINIPFLGKNLELIGIARDADSVTINVGQEYRLNANDCVQTTGLEGAVTVCLKGTSSTKAEVDIGGQVEVISEDSSKTKKGVEVRVEDIFDEEGTSLDSATLFVGADARKTYNDGNEFIGEDEDDPIWVWDLASLDTQAPRIGVLLDLNIDDVSEDDNPLVKHPLYEGEYLCLPWNYACVIHEGPNQKDDEFGDYQIEATTRDLYQNSTDLNPVTAARVLAFKAQGQSNSGFVAGGTDTDTIYLQANGTYNGNAGSGYVLYRKEQDGSKALRFASLDVPVTNDSITAFNIDYKSSTIPVSIRAAPNATNTGQIWIDISELGTLGGFSNLTLFVRQTNANAIEYFGHTDGDTSVVYDVSWNRTGALGAIDISSYAENTRLAGGMIVVDPDSTSASDKLKLRVPPDVADFKVNVRVAQPKGLSKPAGTVFKGSITGVVSKKDTDVLANLSDWNVISVGGPAINEVTAKLKQLSFPTYGTASGISPGEAVIELMKNGNNWALIVAGYDKENTRAAGMVLKNYKDNADKLKGTSVVVKGIESGGITIR